MSFVSWKHDKRWKRFKTFLSPWFETCWPNANPPIEWLNILYVAWPQLWNGKARTISMSLCFCFLFAFFVRRLRHFSKMSRTKLARLGKQRTGIHQYHLWSRTVVPKHSENYFGKMCATFFKHSFWTTILPWKKTYSKDPLPVRRLDCWNLLCLWPFFVNSWGERRSVHWNNFQNQKWKPSWMKQNEKIWNFRFWAWYGPGTALIRPWYGRDTAALVPFFLQKSS